MQTKQKKTLPNREFRPQDLILQGYDPSKLAEGYVFSQENANKAINWIEKYCSHIDGPLRGKPFLLEEWMKVIVANLYGWVDFQGNRRYHEAFIYVPRKNSKTTLLACLNLYELMGMGENGAQVYSVAANLDQAATVFKMMVGMIELNASLSKRCKVYNSIGSQAIEYNSPKTGRNIYRCLASEGKTLHSKGASFLCSDECHSMDGIYSESAIVAIQSGMKHRANRLVVHITTADNYDPERICNKLLDYAKKVRDDVHIDATFYPALWYAEPTDDWKSEETWKKANPNYGKSVLADAMKQDAIRAENEPSFLQSFLRENLNVTTSTTKAWLKHSVIENAVDKNLKLDQFKHIKTIRAGMDLSDHIDLTAITFYDPVSGKVWAWFFMPEECVAENSKRDGLDYARFAREGHLVLTSGNTVDRAFLRQFIVNLHKEYSVQFWGMDNKNAKDTHQALVDADHVPMMSFGQNYADMNSPTKNLEVLLMKNLLKLPNNPLMIQHLKNAQIKRFDDGNIKVVKEYKSSTARVDGTIALIIAIGVSDNNPILNGKIGFSWG